MCQVGEAQPVLGRPRDVLLGCGHERCRDHFRVGVEPGSVRDGYGGERVVYRSIGISIRDYPWTDGSVDRWINRT